MTRYWISLLVFLTGFIFAIFLTGQSFIPLINLPSFITVGLVPFLFVSVLFGFREMKAAYRTALQKEPDADCVLKSQGFFAVFGSTITRFLKHYGVIIFMFIYLNSNGKYEFYSIEAFKNKE